VTEIGEPTREEPLQVPAPWRYPAPRREPAPAPEKTPPERVPA